MYKLTLMFKERCISITDLRTQTAQCLHDLKGKPKIVFVNNKPKAVLMDIDEYEKHHPVVELVEMSEEEITPEIRAKVEKVRKMDISEMDNI